METEKESCDDWLGKFFDWFIHKWVGGGLFIILGWGMIKGFHFYYDDPDKVTMLLLGGATNEGLILIYIGVFYMLPTFLQKILAEIAWFFIRPLIPKFIKNKFKSMGGKFNNWIEDNDEKD